MRCSSVFFFAAAICSASAVPTHAQELDRPKPVGSATSIRLIERGAILAEDYSSPSIDLSRWRIWQQNPAQTSVTIENSRLAIAARGPVAMNGLWGLVTAKYKDVSLVAEMDIRSKGPRPHRLALHLCGGDDRRSPDHWVEVLMTDLGDSVRFSPGAALPEGFAKHPDQSLQLPHPAGQGFLCRVDLDGVTNLAELWVRATDGWKQVCEPIELPLRTVHTEVKINGNLSGKPGVAGETTSHAWFDNVRIYPRPQSHHVGIRLVRPDGSPIYVRNKGAWPPIIADSAGNTRKISDLRIELRTRDGSRPVASSQSPNFGFYLLPLKDAPWDVYPVDAQIRVLLDNKPLGQPLRIECQGCDGLYPDDVYEVVMQ